MSTQPQAIEHKDPGWRKLAVWALVYLLCAYMLLFGRVNSITGELLDIPERLESLLRWVTGGFFLVNGGVHGIRAFSAALAQWKK